MLELPDTIEPPTLVTELAGRGLFADAHGRVLRLSPGPVTSPAAVERLCRALAELV